MRLLRSLLHLTILSTITLVRCRRPRPNPMLGALKNIMSPGNTDRAMKMVRVAAQRNTGNIPTLPPYNPPQIPIPISYSSPPIINPLQELPCNLPLNPVANTFQIPNILPTPVNPNAYPIPNILPANTPCPFTSNPLAIPNPGVPNPLIPIWPSTMPEVVLESKTFCPKEIAYPPQEVLPCYYPNPVHPKIPEVPLFQEVAPNYFYPNNPPAILPTMVEAAQEVAQNFFYPSPLMLPSVPEIPVPVVPPQEIYTCPIPSPAALFDPYLPAASPVSSWSQTTPPALASGSRSQYLRKIPIPPPTL